MSIRSISQTGTISNILFKGELKEVSCFSPVTQIQGAPCAVRGAACSFIWMACRLLLRSFIIQVGAVLTALQFHFSSKPSAMNERVPGSLSYTGAYCLETLWGSRKKGSFGSHKLEFSEKRERDLLSKEPPLFSNCHSKQTLGVDYFLNDLFSARD